ncbi:probable NADH dehydrogenase [ubiquinone] 1 alpha subcomplex subunit 12 [Amyelois transitella]|uniref:probable NADH dehydrogenase [ubiquinone] 1 alpha subcomplex subunit 12 n=1 Tax=Amyelois transitella TaxID=680683 RepID=UPI00298FA6F5|nr:probable NADH dehydrogenase [ubiquinone] 1 alpha subcomplex subunit 12 [Amyelois transitella]
MSIVPFDKFSRFFRIISQHGGIINSILDLWRHDTLKEGMLVGVDSMGNKYYQNCNYMLGRNRWVIYNSNVKFEYDASQVSPEWYGWLHYKTDCKPCEDLAKYCLCCCSWYHRWLLPHQENATGTEQAYYPYSTVVQPISVWNGSPSAGGVSGGGAATSWLLVLGAHQSAGDLRQRAV